MSHQSSSPQIIINFNGQSAEDLLSRLVTKQDLQITKDRIVGIIMAEVSGLAARFAAIEAGLDKVKGEVLAEIQSLKDQLEGVDVPEDAEETLERIEQKVAAWDLEREDLPPPTEG